MKIKKIPLRSCVVSREKLPKNDLFRVVKTPEGEVKVDLTGKLNGHGAYIKKDKVVIEKAKKTKVLDRYLETTVKEEVYDELISSLGDNNE